MHTSVQSVGKLFVRVCVWSVGLPEPLYKTVYVDSATLGVRLADSAAEPIRQFYVQYRPTGEALCRLFRVPTSFLVVSYLFTVLNQFCF